MSIPSRRRFLWLIPAISFWVSGLLMGLALNLRVSVQPDTNAPPPTVYNFTPIRADLKDIDSRLSRIEAVVVGKPHKLENQ